MSSRALGSRRGRARQRWGIPLGACLSALPRLLWAAEGSHAQECNRAYVETQRLERAAQFRAARRAALQCGQETCSVSVRSQCAQWLEAVERATPSIVLDVRDAAGADLVDVRVEVNGEPLAERLDGRALELDPGESVLRFVHADQVIEQRTLIREAEKFRRVEVRFSSLAPAGSAPLPPESGAAAPPAAPPPASEASAALPAASYVFAGVAAVSLGSFAVLGLSGYAAERHLRQSCGSSCDPRAVQHVRARYLAADIALGVGLSSLGAALAIQLWTPRSTNGAGPSSTTLSFSAQPGPGRWSTGLASLELARSF